MPERGLASSVLIEGHALEALQDEGVGGSGGSATTVTAAIRAADHAEVPKDHAADEVVATTLVTLPLPPAISAAPETDRLRGNNFFDSACTV